MVPIKRLIALSSHERVNVIWTIPNIICLVRIVGSFALVGLAIAQLPYWFAEVYLVLAASDLVDGEIARRYGQSSALGAGLDSLADIVLSISLLIGVALIRWSAVWGELGMIAIAIVSYLIAVTVCFLKFRRLPSFHTYTAKGTHFLVAVGGVCLVLDWSVWPLRIAAISIVLTNLESLAIIFRLKDWRTDVPSVFSIDETKAITIKQKAKRAQCDSSK